MISAQGSGVDGSQFAEAAYCCGDYVERFVYVGIEDVPKLG